MSVGETITYHALRLARTVILHLPPGTAATAGERLGALLYSRFPVRKQEALKHLSLAFPHRNRAYRLRLLKKVYVHFGQMVVDLLRLEAMDLDHDIVVENLSCLEGALKENKGVILLSGHLGNWELIPAWCVQHGYPLYPVVKRQKNDGANRFLMDLRKRSGSVPVYRNSSSHYMIQVLRKRHILALASDQHAPKGGIPAVFFGSPASTARGLAIFHRRTGAPLIMAYCLRAGKGTYHLKFQDVPLDPNGTESVAAITQRFTSLLEEEIRLFPEQYFWFHRRWKPSPEKKLSTYGSHL
ncbi:MAG: lysophospholipid acyltransferase family protein [Fidelibacterota bacterium]